MLGQPVDATPPERSIGRVESPNAVPPCCAVIFFEAAGVLLTHPADIWAMAALVRQLIDVSQRMM